MPYWLIITLEIIFWLSVSLAAHTYLFYPFILFILAKNKTLGNKPLEKDNYPFLSIILAAHNEEKVMDTKLQSILDNEYPTSRYEILIGTDACTDNTDNIIQGWLERLPLKHLPFTQRTGKAGIINSLITQARGEVLIMTDANVYFDKHLMRNLARHFFHSEIAVVGANIINTNIKTDGISYQERTYLVNENRMKYREGLLWGAMIGAFGGCYAIRREEYVPVPPAFFMDDFFITMSVLANGKKAILDPEAFCHEDISNIIYEEFRRKVRISIGNFQNLSVFKKKLTNPLTGKGFAFLSHKIIRWITPFLLILSLVISGILAFDSILYQILFATQLFLMILPITDFCLRKINLHSVILRFITHFYSMNLALLIGFFKYRKGVKSNVWEPTKRFQ